MCSYKFHGILGRPFMRARFLAGFWPSFWRCECRQILSAGRFSFGLVVSVQHVGRGLGVLA